MSYSDQTYYITDHFHVGGVVDFKTPLCGVTRSVIRSLITFWDINLITCKISNKWVYFVCNHCEVKWLKKARKVVNVYINHSPDYELNSGPKGLPPQ
jgi:hypothetical protein